MIPGSTPIEQVRARLPEVAALDLPPHVRTAHDLLHAIQRGEIVGEKKTLTAIARQVGAD